MKLMKHYFFQVVPASSSELSDEVRNCVQRFGPPSYPGEQNWDSVGFFIARFKKQL
jgi:hypothetical protein